LSPITAALLGSLLLHEPLTVASLAGLAFVALGLWIAHLQPPEPRASP
jgi:drug/metabolite transporter (DMT)-like permease